MTHQMQALDFSAPIGSIAAYEAYVGQIPLLTESQEQDWAQQWYATGDLQAARQLVLAHLRFVVKIARQYMGYGLPHADLIQEGNVGLMKAVKRFNPTLGVRLAAFAVHWIKSEIHEFVLRNWRLVRIATTKAQRKLFFNLRRLKKGFTCLTPQEVQMIAEDLKVSPKAVQEMEVRLQAQDVFLDVSEEDALDPYSTLPVAQTSFLYQDPAEIVIAEREQHCFSQKLQQALAQLPQRTREIILARHFAEEKTNLKTLADAHGISAERVRQIEQAGMQQLRQRLAYGDIALIGSSQ